jgi:hypothetical protein
MQGQQFPSIEQRSNIPWYTWLSGRVCYIRAWAYVCRARRMRTEVLILFYFICITLAIVPHSRPSVTAATAGERRWFDRSTGFPLYVYCKQ